MSELYQVIILITAITHHQGKRLHRHQKFIRVERSYKRGRFEKTKNGKARRVDISDQPISAFRELLTARKKEAVKLGLGEAS